MLEMALINWTLSEVMKRGFTPLTTPEIVRSSVVEKCGFQPRGSNTQVCLYFSFFNLFQTCFNTWTSCSMIISYEGDDKLTGWCLTPQSDNHVLPWNWHVLGLCSHYLVVVLNDWDSHNLCMYIYVLKREGIWCFLRLDKFKLIAITILIYFHSCQY